MARNSFGLPVSGVMYGQKALDKALKELPKSTGKSVLRSALRRSAKPTQAVAKTLAPEGFTGNLRGSITISTRLKKTQQPQSKVGDVEVYVGATTPKGAHAHLLEFGTVKMAPQPFMRPAWNSTKRKVLDTLEAEIWRSIAKSARTLARKAAKGTLSKTARRHLLKGG